MTARVLDGRAVAKQIYEEVTAAVGERVSRGSSRPRLATMLVGEDPASAKYVDLKQRNAPPPWHAARARECGGGRSQQPGRQADGLAPAQTPRDRDPVSHANEGPRESHVDRRHSGRRSRPRPPRGQGDGQGGGRSRGRQHQLGRWPPGGRPWRGRRNRCRMAHPQPRWCRSNDARHADPEHLRGRGSPTGVGVQARRSQLTYQQALDFISKQGRFAMKLGTERTRAILDRLGAPDRELRGALIAGTNGKGSTGACLTSILRAAGHGVGFMPKPHLVSYTERIELNGSPISEGDFVATLEALMPTLDEVASEMGPATEFEMLTAMAIAYLAPRIELLVCEVGLGGRLDATNALDLGIAVITNVDLDHQKYLGNTIGEIAREKAAIIKHGNRVVTGCEGEALAIVEAQADAMAAQVWRLGRDVIVDAISLGWGGHELSVRGPDFAHRDLRLPLVGDYQPANAALAVAAARLLGVVGDDAIREGLASTNWPGRLQVIGQHPRVIVDGGHNPAAMVKAGTALRRLIGSEKTF